MKNKTNTREWEEVDPKYVYIHFCERCGKSYQDKVEEIKDTTRKDTLREVEEIFNKSFVTTDVYLTERFLNKLDKLQNTKVK